MRSMTGYGKGQFSNHFYEITIELKSVNNRYIDMQFRMPSAVSQFENKLREIIKKNVSRGKLNIYLDLKRAHIEESGALINKTKLNQYHSGLKEINKQLGIKDPLTLNHILSFKDIFETNYDDLDDKQFFLDISAALNNAINAFNTMRAAEGSHLKEDMRGRIELITKIMDEITHKAPENVKMEFEKLTTRIDDILAGKIYDKERMELEIALISDKVDISEEITRMHSHLEQFNTALQKEGELGKKLTFILQEMLREANTMNSKSTDISITQQIIKIKEEIEKIREQAQNIE